MSHFNVAVFHEFEDVQLEDLLAPFDEQVEGDSPYAEFEEDDCCEVDERTGKRGYWQNPNARWDWYEVGGRWNNMLKKHDGTRCDSALVSECDFSPNEVSRKKALRFWEINVEGAKPTEAEKNEFWNIYKPEYYIEQYGDKETFADSWARFETFAFLTADGEWNEVGRMGFWGFNDATMDSRTAYQKAFEKYLDIARRQNLRITIVDCHI